MTAVGGIHRTALDTVLRESAPQAAVHELLGERRLWWKSCSEAARTDPAWLSEGPAEALADWIDANAPDGEPLVLTPARHALLLARALASPPDQDEALVSIRALWAASGLLSAGAAPGPVEASGRGLEAVPGSVAARLDAVLERIPHLPGQVSPAPDSMLVTAVLLMAGCKPGRRVQVPVVFGETERRGEAGATGVLELREFPAGPPGLYPDPRYMTGLRNADGQFATALGRAWAVAGRGRGARCVLWRLVFTDRSPTRVEGPSLGAAFALGLRELLRYPQRRRPSVAWLRGVFYGLRPRTAVTGALGHGERLDGVSGMEDKLLAARRKGLRLVAPAANRHDVAHAPEPADVTFAETLREADRYARRFRTGRLVTAVVLVSAMVASGGVVHHREAAARERVAQAHRMAEVSEDLLSTDVTLAGLFAERAYRQHADPQTRKALFRAVTASPHLAASVRAAGTVSAVAASQNGGRALTGSRGGEVETWDLEGGRFTGHHRRLGRLPGPVETVASDADGRVVAASDDRTVSVWTAGEDAAAPRLPHGHTPTAVAVSPSGRFVAVASESPVSEVRGTLSVLDRVSGRTGHLELAGMSSSAPSALAFDGDDELVVVEFAYGSWNRVSVPRLRHTAGSTLGFGVHNAAAALAPDGSHFTYSNKSSPLPVWPSQGRPDIDEPGLVADTEPGLPSALAVSRGGTHVAVAIGSTLRVSRTHRPAEKGSGPLALPGAGPVSANALAFLGSGGDRLLSASSDALTLWDLRQHTRIAWESKADIPGSCLSCAAPQVAVAPDGQDAAVLDGLGTRLSLSRLGPPGTKPRGLEGTMRIPEFSALVWRPDSSLLTVLAPDGSAQGLARGGTWRPAGSWPPVPNPLGLSDPPALARYLPGGREVAEVHMSGTVWFRDAESGKPLRKVDGPRSMAPTADGYRHPATTKVALHERGSYAAVLEEPVLDAHGTVRVHVISTASGGVRTLPAAGARGLVYSGDHLLIQHDSGTIEVWSASGDRRLGTAEGVDDPAVGPVTDGRLLAGTTVEDQTVRLLDRASQTGLGALPLPEHNFANSTGLALTPDGTGLVTATEADYSETDSPAADGPITDRFGTLIQWRLDPRDWIRTVCATAGRELRPHDWEQHMDTPAPASLRCGE
ncbi:WD40 repeat domain-containing protein [Streptomyces sp. NPDC127114]|uniref:WD40 repeat domain-containing protein n=1 Tax=Streptomyces sp. NPDC127114 TaxID=3345366 RepID=UPI0036329049